VTALKAVPNPAHGPAENFREQPNPAEGGLGHVDLSRDGRADLLAPDGWNQILETFARTMKVAVALTGPEGRLLGECHNPQPAWRMASGARLASAGGCPFCLAPPTFCSAVTDTLRTGRVVTVEDQAGLSHAAVPLSLGGSYLGALIAGQVFSRYPEPLLLQRVARDFGVSRQQLWHVAIQQVPVPRSTLRLYADLLRSVGEAFLAERYAGILQRELAQTSQRYRLIIEGVREFALFTMDRHGLVTNWNSGAERLFGYTAAEMLGQKCGRILIPGDMDREALRQEVAEADRSDRQDRRRNGQAAWLRGRNLRSSSRRTLNRSAHFLEQRAVRQV